MNLFVAGAGAVDERALEAALRELLERLPFFPGRPVETWRSPRGDCALAFVTHGPEQTGGVRYVRREPDRMALFAGRPYLWRGDGRADGSAPLDPAFFLDFDEAALDGRWVALRYRGEGPLEAFCDRLGAYPLFEAATDGARYVSNNAELLRSLHGGRRRSEEVLASFLGGGWSLTGDPLWSDVRRLRPATPAPPLGGGFDAERAASGAVAAVRALAGWPGRANVVPVTGGRDSRLVLGAALAAGIDFETVTGGVPGQPDVDIGRALAEAAGVPHRLIEDDPHGSVASDWRRAAELLSLTAPGTASLADAAGFPFGPRPGPLPLWHSGQGGEVARAYYGSGEGLDRDGLADRLLRAFTGRRPGRADPLGEHGRALVRAHIEQFVDSRLEAGIDPADVPDLFYLERRMGTWAGPSHGAVEYVRDTTSPLWSERLLRDELGLPAGERALELFHLRVLERLAPQLVEIPFEDGRGWPSRESALGRRAQRVRSLARKTRGELRRRVAPAGTAASGDAFARVLPEIRAAVLEQPEHDAWRVLDRARAEQLLASEPAALDTMSRYYVWRLATVFGPTA